MSRTAAYALFKKHEKDKDDRSMDELCSDESTDFRLQAQQEFLQDYITRNPNWRNLLMYHLAGSGKTCTAITMAERYKELNPDATITVVLPARLRTNFIDEIISPCGMQKYISEKQFRDFHNPTTPEAVKDAIRKQFMAAIRSAYDIITFDTMRRKARQAKSLSSWVTDFTKNKLIIVDEVHNLISDKYKDDNYTAMINQDRLPDYVKGSWAMLFRVINEQAHSSCKMIYLTASPIFDNLKQLHELVLRMSPDAEEQISIQSNLSQVIQHLRGKVSYFPGTSPNAYPMKEFVTHEIEITKPIDDVVDNLKLLKKSKSHNNENSEAFLIKERQALVSVLSPSQISNAKKQDFVVYAPKVVALVEQIESLKGKHVVYSSFIENGLSVVEVALRLHGWRHYGEKGGKPYKVYCLWDGRLKDNEKEILKTVFNSVDNIDGKNVRLVLGSPSIKEGVSFKHVQHLHMLDPVWNGSALMQVEARAVRFCSHVDIPESGLDGLERKVVIHYYKTIPMKTNGKVLLTADQRIYDNIIPRKKKMVELGEKALQKTAIDYYLFRKLYRNPNTLSPIPARKKGVPSPITLDQNVRLSEKSSSNSKSERKPKCGRALVPKDGDCPEGYHMRFNNRGDACCYKTKQRKPKVIAPAAPAAPAANQ
jgi:hypothetical protein